MVPGGTPASDYVWCLDPLIQGYNWDSEGSWRKGWDGPLDLIVEVYVNDTPPADAPSPETKNLRDEFAITALRGLVANPNNIAGTEGSAKWAYRYADAMMEARKK
jgi:hypothetical protein